MRIRLLMIVIIRDCSIAVLNAYKLHINFIISANEPVHILVQKKCADFVKKEFGYYVKITS